MMNSKYTSALSVYYVRGLLTIYGLIFFIQMKGQETYSYNTAGTDCHCKMIFFEEKINPKGVLVQDVGDATLEDFANNNSILESGYFDGFSFLYIKILNKGQSDITDCIDAVIITVSSGKRINIPAFYFLDPIVQSDIVFQRSYSNPIKWNILHYDSDNLKNLSDLLQRESAFQPYRPLTKYFNYQEEFRSRMENYKRNFDVGLSWSPHFLTGNKLGKASGAMAPLGLTFKQNISQNWAIQFSIGGGLKRPDMTNIQSSLQGKIFTAIQEEEDSVYIDERITGHVFFGSDFSIIRYKNTTEAFRPYFSVGVGFYNIINIDATIQDTIDISDIDMSDPSSMQDALGDGFDPDSAGEQMDNATTQFIAPILEYGFEYRVAPAFKINASIPVKYFIDRSGNNNSSLSIGMNFKILFTLNSGKYSKLKTVME